MGYISRHVGNPVYRCRVYMTYQLMCCSNFCESLLKQMNRPCKKVTTEDWMNAREEESCSSAKVDYEIKCLTQYSVVFSD